MMRAGSGQHFEQSYNAQAAVETDSRLIIAGQVTDAPNDKQQLIPTIGTVSPVVKSIAAVLVDSGYYSATAVATVEVSESQSTCPKVYAATARQRHGRTVAQLEKHADPPPPATDAPAAEHMAYRLQTQAGRGLYALRKQTIEPVFGIIKEALGFRRFSLRGLAKVNLAWTVGAPELQPQTALPHGSRAPNCIKRPKLALTHRAERDPLAAQGGRSHPAKTTPASR